MSSAYFNKFVVMFSQIMFAIINHDTKKEPKKPCDNQVLMSVFWKTFRKKGVTMAWKRFGPIAIS